MECNMQRCYTNLLLLRGVYHHMRIIKAESVKCLLVLQRTGQQRHVLALAIKHRSKQKSIES